MSQLARENPEATEEELGDLAAAALLKADVNSGRPYEVRDCRDCGARFNIDPAISPTRKWGSLCAACLRYEL